MRKIAILAIVTLCSASALALTNPGFETGDLTGWTLYGPEGAPIDGNPQVMEFHGFGGHTPSEGQYLLAEARHGSHHNWGIYQQVRLFVGDGEGEHNSGVDLNRGVKI